MLELNLLMNIHNANPTWVTLALVRSILDILQYRSYGCFQIKSPGNPFLFIDMRFLGSKYTDS